uniref:Uncharacterized protein n=1 Tax=Acrobeloides nanus TaxID=290746 RepID=A0A914EIM8_9BILA
MYLLAFLVAFLNVQHTLTQVYHVIDFNATGNGIADDTNAVRAAVAAAINSNGGRVVNFILDIRGTILGSQNSDHYALVDPLPWNGIEEGSGPLDRQALIEVYNASNITITGGGVIDGQGAPWWACSWNATLFAQAPCSNLSR